jgi:hypothetical protein
MFRTADRILAFGGVCYIVLAVVGFSIDSPYLGDFESAPATMLQHLEAHPPTAMFWLGLTLELLGLLALVLFAARITAALAPAGWWSWATGWCALLAVAIKVTSIAGALEAYLRPARLGPQVVAGLMGFDDVADSAMQGTLAVSMVVAGLAMFRMATVPRWLASAGIVAGAATLAAAVGIDIAQIGGLLWFIAAGWWLLRRAEPSPARAVAATS